jgi:hypothetical protein
MIEVTLGDNDAYFVKMGMKSPIVYLDHWAVAKISGNPVWRSRFIKALNKKGGTLLFSYLNIVELGRHLKAQPNVKVFLEEVGTHWCFIDVDAPAVIEREGKSVSSQMPPCFDERGLNSYYPYIHEGPLTLGKIVELVGVQKDRCDAIYARSDEIVAQLTAIQAAIKRGDPNINPDAYRSGGLDPKRPTRYVYYSLMRSTLHGNLVITRNHVCDLLHATAALSQADFILLDKHWCQQAKDLLKELPNIQHRVFKDSPEEMDRFLRDF